MREVAETYKVYKFSELKEEAKERVRSWYLDDFTRGMQLEEMLLQDLQNLFPHSSLKVQYSLCYCQGDGLNIYGELNVYDVFQITQEKEIKYFERFWDAFTEREIEILEQYLDNNGSCILLPQNSRDCYSGINYLDFAEEWHEEMLWYDESFKNISDKVIYKLQDTIKELFGWLNSQYEELGYKYLYEADDEEIEDMCEANDWEFLEDGAVA